MPINSRKAKPEGARVNRAALKHDWVEVPDVPFEGGPLLPSLTPLGDRWPEATIKWWNNVRRMPHCALWSESDWQYALDTAWVAAKFHTFEWKAAGELRQREKAMGTTMAARMDLRIRYIDPNGESATPEKSVDDYLDLYSPTV